MTGIGDDGARGLKIRRRSRIHRPGRSQLRRFWHAKEAIKLGAIDLTLPLSEFRRPLSATVPTKIRSSIAWTYAQPMTPLPPTPPVAASYFPLTLKLPCIIQRMLDDPDCSIEALGKLISAEPILAPRVPQHRQFNRLQSRRPGHYRP